MIITPIVESERDLERDPRAVEQAQELVLAEPVGAAPRTRSVAVLAFVYVVVGRASTGSPGSRLTLSTAAWR